MVEDSRQRVGGVECGGGRGRGGGWREVAACWPNPARSQAARGIESDGKHPILPLALLHRDGQGGGGAGTHPEGEWGSGGCVGVGFAAPPRLVGLVKGAGAGRWGARRRSGTGG
jgi:hypothetical protein